MSSPQRLTGEPSRLRALARRRLDDEFVDDYDTIDDDGNKIREVTVPGPEGTTRTREVNWSALFGPTPSTSGSVDLLLTEAKLAAEGRVGDNPHIPVDEATAEAVRDRCAERDLTPAWEVVEG